MRILLALMILRVAPAMAAFELSQPLGDYQLVSVFRMGDYSEAVVQHDSGERFRLKEGVSIDGYLVTQIVPRSHASYVELERLGGRYQITMARAGELENRLREMSLAEVKGHVDANGRLTNLGRRMITQNLEALANAAYIQMKKTGVDRVDLNALAKYYQPSEYTGNADPFAPPQRHSMIRRAILELQSIAGEDYARFQVTRHAPKIAIRTSAGELVEVPFASQFLWPDSKPHDVFALFAE